MCTTHHAVLDWKRIATFSSQCNFPQQIHISRPFPALMFFLKRDILYFAITSLPTNLLYSPNCAGIFSAFSLISNILQECYIPWSKIFLYLTACMNEYIGSPLVYIMASSAFHHHWHQCWLAPMCFGFQYRKISGHLAFQHIIFSCTCNCHLLHDVIISPIFGCCLQYVGNHFTALVRICG